MTKNRRARRISWKVRRDGDQWIPIVYMGEEPTYYSPEQDRRDARRVARARAKTFTTALLQE